MKISETGEGLGILLKCKPIMAHGWMSFAAWYSFNKNLPDAKIAVNLEKGTPNNFMMWCWKMKVPFSQSTDKFKCLENKEIMVLKPEIMAVRAFDPERIGPSKVKLNEFTTFVDYSDGVGSFVTSEWIDKEAPFGNGRRFGKHATVVENKILSLWDKCRELYSV